MSKVTIEKIDQVISRMPHIKYEQAKDALIKTDGDVLDAIIYLESLKVKKENKNIKEIFEESLPKDSQDLKALKNQALGLIKKGSVIRVIVEKEGKTVLNIPLTVGVVGVALGPVFALFSVSAAFISKYEIKIQNEEDGKEVNLGSLTLSKINMIKEMLSDKSKENKEYEDVYFDDRK